MISPRKGPIASGRRGGFRSWRSRWPPCGTRRPAGRWAWHFPRSSLREFQASAQDPDFPAEVRAALPGPQDTVAEEPQSHRVTAEAAAAGPVLPSVLPVMRRASTSRAPGSLLGASFLRVPSLDAARVPGYHRCLGRSRGPRPCAWRWASGPAGLPPHLGRPGVRQE